MTKELTALEKIWADIEDQRAALKSEIAMCDDAIAQLNARKKSAREGLDALPVAKTRRPKKSAGRVLADVAVEEFIGDRDRTSREESRGAG